MMHRRGGGNVPHSSKEHDYPSSVSLATPFNTSDEEPREDEGSSRSLRKDEYKKKCRTSMSRRRSCCGYTTTDRTVTVTAYSLTLTLALVLKALLLLAWVLVHRHFKLSPPRSVQLPQRNNILTTIATAKTTTDIILFGFTPCGTSNSTRIWREIAIEYAKLPVSELLVRLEEEDPFGVRALDKNLIAKELELGRTLTPSELKALFPCPKSCWMTSVLNPETLSAPTHFRNSSKSSSSSTSWLLFQHLRKAGGTHFCTLARANLPKSNVADYYCMPDYRWSNYTCAGCLERYSNAELIQRMTVQDRYKIAGNEWDNFAARFLELAQHHHVVLATSFRKPLDRALSQFRFECVEDRGCTELNISKWWNQRQDLYNIYTTTFADKPGHYAQNKIMYLDQSPHEQKRGALMARAYDVVQQLHLVLCMEWLAYAGPLVTAVLGFADVSALTKRVRPLNTVNNNNNNNRVTALRRDSQEQNRLGAASIYEASWDPKVYLSTEQYRVMSETLALDTILTDVARRIVLERTVCREERLTSGTSRQ